MKYGCIGEKLGHSFSKEIHTRLSDNGYELCEVAREELDAFMERRDFLAINVTIPYKEAVMPHLYYIDPHAKAIGATNTVVNRNGKLYGYNTDFYGMRALIDRLGVTPEGKKVLILGTGGTSRTADAVARSYGAAEVIKVGRRGDRGSVTYEVAYRDHRDAEFIINTTPVGMFPDTNGKPIELSQFDRLSGVVDAIYNPLRTTLVSEALAMGIPAEGGLYMLVAQGVRASEIFLDKSYPDGTLDRIYDEIYREKENIVLIGMPSSGKSTVGKILSEKIGKALIDTDDMIKKRAGMEIPEIFRERGECGFRDLESEAVLEAAAMHGVIIATGGGAVLREKNVRALSKNGRIYFLDRSPELLVPTADRPLSSDRDTIMKRYNERYAIYCKSADVRIDGDRDAETVAETIILESKK